MEYSSLSNLIKYLQYGTKLHIGLIFFRDYNIECLNLVNEQKIHNSTLCQEFKNSIAGYKNCYKCRTCAIRKAISTQKDFGGLCFNGIFEYMRPVIINGKCICIIYIGNIVGSIESRKILSEKLGDKAYLISSAETNFDIDKCKEAGEIIEGYIRLVYDKYLLEKNETSDSLMENIINYVRNSSQYDIKLKHIAECFHYNEQYLGRFFKKKTGKSFNEYLNIIRVGEAKKLLESTNESIIDIALRVGFNNVTYFNRVFKRIEGVTPGEIRLEKI